MIELYIRLYRSFLIHQMVTRSDRHVGTLTTGWISVDRYERLYEFYEFMGRYGVFNE